MSIYWLYKDGDERHGERVALTAAQYARVRHGWGDYRVVPLTKAVARGFVR